MILLHTLILNVTSLGLESAPDNGACDDSKGLQKSPLLSVVYSQLYPQYFTHTVSLTRKKACLFVLLLRRQRCSSYTFTGEAQ